MSSLPSLPAEATTPDLLWTWKNFRGEPDSPLTMPLKSAIICLPKSLTDAHPFVFCPHSRLSEQPVSVSQQNSLETFQASVKWPLGFLFLRLRIVALFPSFLMSPIPHSLSHLCFLNALRAF